MNSNEFEKKLNILLGAAGYKFKFPKLGAVVIEETFDDEPSQLVEVTVSASGDLCLETRKPFMQFIREWTTEDGSRAVLMRLEHEMHRLISEQKLEYQNVLQIFCETLLERLEND